jgi:hypothetical protein
MVNNKSQTGGVGLSTVLFIVFLVLKLTNHIDWSWWWVTSPLWIPIAFIGAIGLFILLFGIIVTLFKKN